MLKRTVVLAGALALGGCATVPPLNFSPSNVAASQAKQNFALISTIVTIAPTSEAKGKIQIAGGEEQVATLWKTAIEDALTRAAIFRDDAPRRLNLVVQVRELKLPAAGIVMVTHTAARYQLIDRATGAVVLTADVDSDGRVPGDFNFYGAIRARESAGRSVQANIAAFLVRLEAADLSGGPQ